MMMEDYFSRSYVLHAALASSLSAPSRYDFGVVRFCLEQPANNNEKMVKNIPKLLGFSRPPTERRSITTSFEPNRPGLEKVTDDGLARDEFRGTRSGRSSISVSSFQARGRVGDDSGRVSVGFVFSSSFLLAVRHTSSCCFRLIYLISESSNQCAWFGIRVRVCMCQTRAIPTTRIRAFARGRRLCHFC